MLRIAKLPTRAFVVTVPLLALAACTQPSAPSESLRGRTELVGICIRRRASQFINGGPR